MSYLFRTEHYEVGAQVRRHGALPARAGLAPRGPARRPELPELLRRPAGEQVRQGRAVGLGRRRAVRRLPVALLPRGRQRRLRRLRREVLRVLAPAGPERACCASCFRPDVWDEIARPADDRHLPRAVPRRGRARRAPRTTSTTRSTSRRRPSCTACSSSRTSSAWPTASRAASRSWTTTSSTSPSACRCGSSCATSSTSCALDENVPSPKTERYFERTRDGKLLLRRVMQRYVPEAITNQVKQGFSGPDASWFRGDSIDYVREMRAQRRLGDVRVPRTRRWCASWSTTTSRAARTAACCCGRCSRSSTGARRSSTERARDRSGARWTPRPSPRTATSWRGLRARSSTTRSRTATCSWTTSAAGTSTWSRPRAATSAASCR